MTTPTTAPTIAVVDDDPSVQRALRRLLRSAGYAVQTFGSGRSFFEDQARDTVACLVLDVHMPDWSGLDLQQALSATGSKLPIIFITGRRNPEAREMAIRNGAAAFLEKPFDEDALFGALSDVLSEAVG